MIAKKTRHLQNISVDNDEITGWLEKKSLQLKQWRERFVVLKQDKIKTYKTSDRIKLTEEIKLDSFTVLYITPQNNFEIKNESTKQSIIFRSANDITTDSWLSWIEQRIKTIQQDLIQECVTLREKKSKNNKESLNNA